jgi:hypothetical protein
VSLVISNYVRDKAREAREVVAEGEARARPLGAQLALGGGI